MYNKIHHLSHSFTQILRSRKEEWVACLLLWVAILPLWKEGHITFSDLAFGKDASLYLNYVLGIFNENLGTPNWFNLPRISWLVIPYLLSQIFSNSGHVLLVSLIYCILAVSTFSFGSLARRFFKTYHLPLSEWTLLAGIMVYALNPWVIFRIQHIFLLCGYALTPLSFSWTWKLFEQQRWEEKTSTLLPSLKELQQYLALGLVVSASFAGIHFGIFIVLMMIGIALVLALSASASAFQQRRLGRWFCWYSLRGILLGGSFILYSLYWIAPFVLSILQGIRPSQNNINAVETVVLLSRASSVENIITGISYWWPMFEHAKLPPIFWFAGYSIWIFVALGIWTAKRFTLAFLLLVGLVLTTGTYFNYLAPTYITLVFDSIYPFGDMLRDPNKLYGVCILPISLFFCVGVQRARILVEQSRSFAKSLLQYIIIAIILFWILPIYRIYLMGYYQPTRWAPEYEALQTEIAKLPRDSKVLYLPSGDLVIDQTTGFSSPDFNKTIVQGVLVPKATASHLALDSRVDTLFPHEGNDVNIVHFIWFLHHLLDENNIDQIGSLAAKAGITHIVIRKDYQRFYERFQRYEDQLKSQQDLELIWTDQKIHLFAIPDAVSDAAPLEQLTYTTGGFERFIWLSRVLNQPIQNLNFIFAYDGHYSSMEELRENDIVETDSKDSLVLASLPQERFVFPADALRSGTPNLRWSKLLVSGYNWEHYSNHYQIANRQYPFDMGRGIAFTVSPLEAPHEAFIDPSSGTRHLEQELRQPERFFHPFEASEIVITPQNRPSSPSGSLQIEVPKTANPDTWQMLESDLFYLEENMLYHLVSTTPHSTDFEINIRIGFYSKDGNRLGTETTEPIVLLPESIEKTTRKSFLSPLGTTFGKLEIRIQNTQQKNLSIPISGLSLFSLENISSPNTLYVTLPEKDFSQEGMLWLRIFCSTEGGLLDVHSGKEHLANIDTTCSPTSKFVWKHIPTKAHISPDIRIVNTAGVNAVNALTWTSFAEWTERENTLHQILSDKTLAHLVDSTEMNMHNVIEDLQLDQGLIGGTFAKGLNGSLDVQLNIIKSGLYTVIIPDYIPVSTDRYRVTIYNQNAEDDETETLLFSQEIDQSSPHREASSQDIRRGRTIFRNIHLPEGNHLLQIELEATNESLLDWKSLAFLSAENPDLQPYTLISEPEKSVSYQLPRANANWGSLQTQTVSIKPDTPLMMSLQFKLFELRDLHGKLHYLDEEDQIIKSVYLTELSKGTEDYQTFRFADTPPQNATQLRVQILARHKIVPSPKAEFSISNFQLWQSNSSIGIDGVLTIEDDFQIAGISKNTTISSLNSTRGERTAQIHHSDTTTNPRIQLFEAPIHHWQFTATDRLQQPFALNAVSFGLNLPKEKKIDLRASVYLNQIWQKGIFICCLGISILYLLTAYLFFNPANATSIREE